MQRRLRFLSGRDVAKALPMPEAVEAMKEAFRRLSAGEAVVPPRTHIAVESPPGDALFMPAYIPATGRMGLKIVTLFGDNAARGLPLIQALVIVLVRICRRHKGLRDSTPRSDQLGATRSGNRVPAAHDPRFAEHQPDQHHRLWEARRRMARGQVAHPLRDGRLPGPHLRRRREVPVWLGR